MDDYTSGLPIRSEKDGLDERVHTKIVDFTDPDGVDKQVEVSEKLIHNRNFGKHPKGTKIEQQFSEEGFTNSRGDYDLTLNEKPSSVGLIAHVRNAALTAAHQVLRLTGVQSAVDTDVTALDVAMRDHEGTPFSSSNPLSVTLEESAGEEIHDYNESAVNVIKDGNDVHTYTVPVDKTLLLAQVLCSTSGRGKFQIEVGDSGAEVSKGVRFTSTSMQDSDWSLKREIKLTAGQVVKVTRYNRDNQPMGLYTTIVGVLNNA